MTEKQRIVHEELVELANQGIEPTVRSLTDRLESKRHRSARFSDGSVRSILTRLERDGHAERLRGARNEVRFRPTRKSTPA